MKEAFTMMYGKHAVLEALRRRPEVVGKVFVREDLLKDAALARALSHASNVETFTRTSLPKSIPSDAVHQGIFARISHEKLLIPFRTFRDDVSCSPDTALVVLGEVQDPHNVGAIIRSAAAFGIQGVLIPVHRQAPVTGTVIKVSAGAAFTVPLVSVTNVNTALRDLRKKGFVVYGLAGDGDTHLPDARFESPAVFIVGNEATGMREKTRTLCDHVLTIPMHGRTESLNASVSAAVTFFAWSVQHKNALS